MVAVQEQVQPGPVPLPLIPSIAGEQLLKVGDEE